MNTDEEKLKFQITFMNQDDEDEKEKEDEEKCRDCIMKLDIFLF